MIQAVDVVVRGVVQGVGFRYATLTRATGLGLSGWVRNRTDGTVEAHLEGPPPAVGEILEWLHRGPAGAVVEGVTVSASSPTAVAGFSIRR